MMLDHETVHEDSSKLSILSLNDIEKDLDIVIEALKQDLVILVRSISPAKADNIMYDVADKLGLGNNLKLQAALAGSQGHRHNIGRYFMSVNKRSDYHFIPPHSEGNSSMGMQLASFFCYENSTDGGETILLNVNPSANIWQTLREHAVRGKISASVTLGRSELAKARMMYKLILPNDLISGDDQILQESPSAIPGLSLAEVLAKPRITRSVILGISVPVYWDSVASFDCDSAYEYLKLLRVNGLLKEPDGGLKLQQLDNSADRRIWHSGAKFAEIFSGKITHKMIPGDFILQNNLTWAHAANNWTPDSGIRKIAASFA